MANASQGLERRQDRTFQAHRNISSVPCVNSDNSQGSPLGDEDDGFRAESLSLVPASISLTLPSTEDVSLHGGRSLPCDGGGALREYGSTDDDGDGDIDGDDDGLKAPTLVHSVDSGIVATIGDLSVRPETEALPAPIPRPLASRRKRSNTVCCVGDMEQSFASSTEQPYGDGTDVRSGPTKQPNLFFDIPTTSKATAESTTTNTTTNTTETDYSNPPIQGEPSPCEIAGFTKDEQERDILSQLGTEVASDACSVPCPLVCYPGEKCLVVGPDYTNKGQPFHVRSMNRYPILRELSPELLAYLDIQETTVSALLPGDQTTFYPHDDGVTSPFPQIDEKRALRCCTLPGLIDLLVGESEGIWNRETLSQEFLLTSRYFIGTNDLLRWILLRFLEERHLSYPQPIHGDTPVQVNLVQLLTSWLRQFPQDWKPKHLALMTAFQLGIPFQSAALDPFIKQLSDLVSNSLDTFSSTGSLDMLLDKAPASEPMITLKRSHGRASRRPSCSLVQQGSQVLSRSSSIGKTHFPLGMTILELDPVHLAHEMTLYDSELFKRIPVHQELFHQQWNKKDRDGQSPHLLAFIRWFNTLAYGVATQILQQSRSRVQVEVMERFLTIAHTCVNLLNFNTTFAIVAGLNTAPIQKLVRAWKLLSKTHLELWRRLNILANNEGNYCTFRRCMTGAVVPGCTPSVPYLGMFLTDLTFLEDGNESWSLDLLTVGFPRGCLNCLWSALFGKGKPCMNMRKSRMLAGVFQLVESLQRPTYSLDRYPEARFFLTHQWSVATEEELRHLGGSCSGGGGGGGGGSGDVQSRRNSISSTISESIRETILRRARPRSVSLTVDSFHFQL